MNCGWLYKISSFILFKWNVNVYSLGAACQSLGRVDEALAYYELAIPHMPNDAGIRNNYGALLGIMNRHEEVCEIWNKRML